jgi:N-acetylneuraminic acid mutarotase
MVTQGSSCSDRPKSGLLKIAWGTPPRSRRIVRVATGHYTRSEVKTRGRRACVLLELFTAATTWMLWGQPSEARALSLQERIQAQEAIERVYYAHQIGDTRPFEEAVPGAVLEKKIRTYLEQSIALDVFWKTPITSVMLRQEVERMAARTRMPERLRELHAALGNEPFLIEEALARPALADRLTRTFFAYDKIIHAETRREAEDLRADLLQGRLDPGSQHPRRTVVDLVRSSTAEEPGSPAGRGGRSLRMALPPDAFDGYRGRLATRDGEIGALEEEREAFVTRVVLRSTPDEIQIATFVVPKLSWDTWWASAEGGFADAVTVEPLPYGDNPPPVPQADSTRNLLGVDCPVSWTAVGLDGAPEGRRDHTSVWTGNVMVVWGGSSFAGLLATGGRYNPAIDTWSPISTTNAPSPRSDNTAVWTGSVMVVWGGVNGASILNTGGRYDPTTDSWTAVSTTNAPSARWAHTAVWTGASMIVWGGRQANFVRGSELETGGRYDPASDTWAPTSTGPNLPQARADHTAVWTGTEMIVWGGAAFDERYCENFVCYYYFFLLNTGARYNPSTDTWTSTSSSGGYVPPPRANHTASWTGTEMIVWGGDDECCGNLYDTGDRYDPATETWTPTSLTNAPSGRAGYTAVWTGSVLVVWGGSGDYGFPLNTGHRYDPATDAWTFTSTVDAPSGRYYHSAIWTGTLMIVWGGVSSTFFDSGGLYTVADPSVDDDGDGFTECQGDCFDGSATVHPGASEICDALDNNCDGGVDGFPTFCGVGQCASTGICTAGADSCLPGSPSAETCDGVDNNCDRVVDNAPVPVGSPSIVVVRFGQTAVLGWDLLSDATRYDVVQGDLGLLQSTGGDFRLAIQACLANDLADTALVLSGSPAPGSGFVYLVRGTNCGGAGTYDSGSSSQVGSRDGEIGASSHRCP